MITEWHHKTAQAYAKAHHGHVNELRRNKASMTLPGYSSAQHRSYYEMEAWLINSGVVIDVSREKQRETPQRVIDKIRNCCQRASSIMHSIA
jgi:hypothetical protein